MIPLVVCLGGITLDMEGEVEVVVVVVVVVVELVPAPGFEEERGLETEDGATAGPESSSSSGN